MFQIEKIREIAGAENVYERELLSKHTTFRIGGPASCYVCPRDSETFVRVLSYVKEEKEPYAVIGNGSNILASDEGFSGVVIATHGSRGKQESTEFYPNFLKTGNIPMEGICICNAQELSECRAMSGISFEALENKTVVLAGSGIMLSKLSSAVIKEGLAGFEFAGGIPGTLGGAVTMNAGAYGGEIKDVLLGAMLLLEDGTQRFYQTQELALGYRTSIIQKNHSVVLWAVFAFEKGDAETMKKTVQELNQKRREKQPLEYASAGSTFKRPEGMFAGKLIEDAGLKGYRVGDVMVSEKHCGFVVNVGAGTSEQADRVIAHVQKTVQEKTGVWLELEVKRL